MDLMASITSMGVFIVAEGVGVAVVEGTLETVRSDDPEEDRMCALTFVAICERVA